MENVTISKTDLNKKELATFESLVRLGDSENTALWTIEHQERKRSDNSAYCYTAYHI